jgi:hypothetical protein
MKHSALFFVGLVALSPALVFGAACPGTTWTKPFPGSNTFSGDTCASGETNSIGSMCGGFNDSPGNDDVYSFTGDGSSVSLTVTPAAGYAVSVQALTGTCGSTGNCVSGASSNTGVDGEAQPISFTAANGTVYYVVITSSSTGTDNCGTYNISGNLPVTLENFSVD